MKLDAVIGRAFPIINQSYTEKDTILYALGVGAGVDPVSPQELPFVFEKSLRIIPSQASVLAYPGFWLGEPELGIEWLKLLHGEQAIIFERPLASAGALTGEFEILGVDDKGPEKGAVIFFEKRIRDAADGGLICRVRSTYFLRGDGGCGSWGAPVQPPSALPDNAPDCLIDMTTRPDQALIYRLSGDYNPIHVDPDAAATAGFERPILHGLCTFGVATYALVQNICEGDPDRIKELFVRFSSPVYPGETIRVEVYNEPNGYRFRARSLERNVIVLDRGLCRLG